MDNYNPRHLVLFGILQIDQVRIAIPNISQAKADQLSKELNQHILGVVDSFVKALAND